MQQRNTNIITHDIRIKTNTHTNNKTHSKKHNKWKQTTHTSEEYNNTHTIHTKARTTHIIRNMNTNQKNTYTHKRRIWTNRHTKIKPTRRTTQQQENQRRHIKQLIRNTIWIRNIIIRQRRQHTHRIIRGRRTTTLITIMTQIRNIIRRATTTKTKHKTQKQHNT